MRLPAGNVQLYCLLVFIAGAITPLAFSPYDFFILAVLAPVPLITVLLRSSPRAGFLYGYTYGLGMFGTGISWLHISINLFGGVNLAGSILLTGLFIVFIALFPGLAGYISSRLARGTSNKSVLLIVPAAWCFSEWVRSWIFTGFPWLNLGYSQTDSPLSGFAPLTGVFGVSFLVVLTSTALVSMFRETGSRRYLPAILIAVAWTTGWLSSSHQWTTPVGNRIDVALVQGAIPQELKWSPEMRQPTLDLYRQLTAPYLERDLIIWPEAAIPAFYHQIEPDIQDLLARLSATDAVLVTGLPVLEEETGRYYNSLVMLDEKVSFYHKRHLVPFGEYLPFAILLQGPVDYFDIPMSDFSRGTAIPLLTSDKFAMGVSICYEDVFGEEVIEALPEAQVLVNVSNDAWFGDSASPHQHMQMARMRAIESGRYMLRSTNTGVSAIIDEKGEVLDRLPQFKPGVLVGTAELYTGMTPYSRLGNYPIIIISLLIIGVAATGKFRKKTPSINS